MYSILKVFSRTCNIFRKVATISVIARSIFPKIVERQRVRGIDINSAETMGNHRLTFTSDRKPVKGVTLNSNCHETPAETRFAGNRESGRKRDQVKGRIYLDGANVSKEIQFRIRGSKEAAVVPTWPA